jgi:hypothetical protein
MVQRNTFIRAANEVSLAVWFGGSLMGATGLERGAAAANGEKHHVESTAWNAWQPLQMAAIATQIASGAALTFANRKRVAGQRGVATTSLVRTAVLGAAIASTVLAARAGSKVAAEAERDSKADDHVDERDERLLRVAQWMVPAFTGAMVVIDALMGEQQRPNQVVRGTLNRILPDALRAA